MPAPSPTTSFFVAGDGVRLVVHDWGGAGAPVVLAHATGFHGRAWAEVAGLLVAEGRHALSFDFRGHGDSDAPAADDGAYSWNQFARDAFAVVDQLGLRGDPGLVACGHSKGGAALLLAELAAPGTFPKIWTYEPIMFPQAGTSAPRNDFLVESARRRRNEWNSADDAYEAYASKPPLDAMTEASLRAYVEYALRDRGDGVLELKCRPDVEARVYEMAPANGLFERLDEIAADVVVACGEVSRSVSPELAQEIVQQLSHGRREVLAGLDHFGPQQDPAACARSILQFTTR